MQKNDTIIYNIYTHTACLFMFKEEYEQLRNPIIEYAKATNQPCNIVIGASKNKFADHEIFEDDTFENIHIVISGQGISKIEKIIKKALSKNGLYKHANKFIIEDNEQVASHIKFLEENSTCQDKIKVTYNDNKKVISIAYQEVIDI